MYFADDALIVTNPELSSCRYMIYMCKHICINHIFPV